MLFRIWQHALMDQPVSSQEIWQWVHTCYGEELGFNSDDEGYSREPPDDPILGYVADNASEELAETSSMEAGGDARDEPRERRVGHARDASPPLVSNGGELGADGDALPTDMSDTSDSEPDKPHNGGGLEKCSNPHTGRLLLRHEFPFPIDQMFTMIFTNSKFNLELLAARATTDYVQAPWQQVGGQKCRQVMNKCSAPGHQYSIDCSSENAGIPYADYFTVEVHYCMTRVTEHSTNLEFYAHFIFSASSVETATASVVKPTAAILAPRASVSRAASRGGGGGWLAGILTEQALVKLLETIKPTLEKEDEPPTGAGRADL
ncbi:hypothetical protein MSG28_009475 [Choristoneura fumiferana]|uniref:Uncharacterized protein n=1 Tax=Choristoneura fumiferana TaxID=7141 RepID=A0ACC0JBL4_CHOFU|nr:hypothetical protein MSG28_009475 [Choristoneura fumiferana]